MRIISVNAQITIKNLVDVRPALILSSLILDPCFFLVLLPSALENTYILERDESCKAQIKMLILDLLQFLFYWKLDHGFLLPIRTGGQF